MDWKKIIGYGLLILIIREIIINLGKYLLGKTLVLSTFATLITILLVVVFFTCYLKTNKETKITTSLLIGLIWYVIIVIGSALIQGLLLGADHTIIAMLRKASLYLVPIITLALGYTHTLKLTTTDKINIDWKRAIGYGIILAILFYIVYYIIGVLGITTSDKLFSVRLFAEIVIFTIIFGTLYITKNPETNTKETLILGAIWWIIMVLIDIILILTGLAVITVPAYLALYPIAYLGFPIILWGISKTIE